MKEWFSKNWLQLIVAISLVVIIVFIFQKRNSPDELNEYILKEKSDSIVLVRHERDSLQDVLNATQDSIINRIDSLLHVQVDNQDKILYELQKKRNTITVPGYDSDTLRNYFSKLLPIYHDLHTE